MNLTTQYEKDFYAWLEHNIKLLRQRKIAEIDIENLIEELESMGKRDKREMVSRVIVLISHLLKWQYQLKQLTELWQTHQGGSWNASITEQRIQLHKQLQDSPSLKSYLPIAVTEAYPDAIKLAIKETRLPLSTFPKTCPYTIEQLLDQDFYPSDVTH